MTLSRRIELSAGTIEYVDTGGEGPAIVLLPGLLMDASLWEQVVAELAPGHRCIVPTLPLGAHRHPMHAEADLSPRGIARLVAEAGRSCSCWSGKAPPASGGSCSCPVTRLTTSLPG